MSAPDALSSFHHYAMPIRQSWSASTLHPPNPVSRVTEAPSPEKQIARKTFSVVYTKLTTERGAIHLPNKIIWLAGAPGAGKGTNTSYIEAASGITAPAIVMSSILDSPLCQAIKAVGGMVDDSVVLEALLQEMADPKYRDGVVIDGFPRTAIQAELIHLMHESHTHTQGTAPDYSIAVLHVSESESIARQMARGTDLQMQNAQRILQGLPVLEARATDLDPVYAATRYSSFERQYASLLSLKTAYTFHLIDASGSREEVMQIIGDTFRPPVVPPVAENVLGRWQTRTPTIHEEPYEDSVEFYTHHQDNMPSIVFDFVDIDNDTGSLRHAYA